MKGLSKLYSVFRDYLELIWSPLNPSIDVMQVPDDFDVNEDGTRIGSSLLSILNGTYDMRGAI